MSDLISNHEDGTQTTGTVHFVLMGQMSLMDEYTSVLVRTWSHRTSHPLQTRLEIGATATGN